jgi:acyl-CoA reductase-like NAD-dependent aldehyde dehydrogenase
MIRDVADDVLPSVQAFLARPKRLLIGGRWVEPRSGRFFPTLDPATGQVLAQVPEAGPDDIDLAVAAARRALEGPWADVPPSERARLLWRLGDLVEKHQEELGQLESLDNGKPYFETQLADLPLTAEHFRYFAGWPTKITGETVPVSIPGKWHVYTRREPVGVVAGIIPWNFPLLFAAWKLGPSLACGNTVVLKPSEVTPLTALRLGELVLEAGFPPGVVNIVTGAGATGAALAGHPGVDKVAFTGSVAVGRQIMAGAARDLKRVSLELGGKSPQIIFPDADFDDAVSGIMMGSFFNQGQICCAGSRLFVPQEEYDTVLAAVVERAESLRQGPGLDPATQMGPLVSEGHMNRVLSYIESGRREGAAVLTGGERNREAGPGYFVRPTILTGSDTMAVAREEVFGPVLVALPFSDLDEVVRRANDSPFGLNAGIWTRDVAKAMRVAHALKAGMIWINGYNLIDAASPWGGWKQSGIHRLMGSYSIEAFTEVKAVWVSLQES